MNAPDFEQALYMARIALLMLLRGRGTEGGDKCRLSLMRQTTKARARGLMPGPSSSSLSLPPLDEFHDQGSAFFRAGGGGLG